MEDGSFTIHSSYLLPIVFLQGNDAPAFLLPNPFYLCLLLQQLFNYLNSLLCPDMSFGAIRKEKKAANSSRKKDSLDVIAGFPSVNSIFVDIPVNQA